MSFNIRTPRLDDAGAVVELVNACTRADVDLTVYEPGELGAEWIAQSADLRVATDAQGDIVGYLETEMESDGLFFEGYVAPGHRGRGIGSTLAAEAEAMASETTAQAITTNVGSKSGKELMENRGYSVVEREYAMFLDLDSPIRVPELPDGVHIRAFVHGKDETSMYKAIRESFEDDWPDAPNDPEKWIKMHQSVPWYDPDLWLLAFVGDEVVGGAMNRTQWRAQKDTGWVKNIGVVRQHRKHGIGAAMLLQTANLFRERGRRRMVLGVSVDNPTGAPDFYRRLGMRVGGASWDLKKAVLASDPTPGWL
jgi:mycothiol synthase